MPKEWHDLHDRLRKENPDMPDSEAWAIATNVYKKKHDGRTPQQDAEKEASDAFKEELLKKKEEYSNE